MAKQIADKSSNSFMANTEKKSQGGIQSCGDKDKRFLEAEDEDSVVVPKKKAAEQKGIDDTKDDMRGESNQEKEKNIMVKKKKLNDQEKEKEVEKEKENEKNKSEERSRSEQAREERKSCE